MTIDAHHHFWNYSAEEYGWLDDSMSCIRRNFLPNDLDQEIRRTGVDGVVSVQARTTIDETRWLLDLAGQNPFVRAVVGWVPLREERLPDELESLCENPRLRALREVMQGQPKGALLDKRFNEGVARLKDFGLAYDILIFDNQLAEAQVFVDRHPEQVFVLDHLAKPRIRDSVREPWASGIREIARRQNVFCKVSGMVTEADVRAWNPDQLRPYFDIALEAFGPDRLMFGSDWPVCLPGVEYPRWLQIVRGWASELSAAEQSELFGGSAIRAYKLK